MLSTSFQPYLPVAPEDFILQGDIFANCECAKTPPSNLELYYILTADCDIDKGKCGESFAALRIVHLRDYIYNIWPSSHFQSLFESKEKDVIKKIQKFHAAHRGEGVCMEDVDCLNWVEHCPATDICSELSIEAKEQKKFIATLNNYSLLKKLYNSSHDNRCLLQSYVESLALYDKAIVKDSKSYVKSKFNRDMLPKDVFLLPKVAILNGIDCVVILRNVIPLKKSDTSTKVADIRSGKYVRVCRLHPTLKFAISSMFAHLYSRIGIPNEYEEMQDNAIEGLKQTKETK